MGLAQRLIEEAGISTVTLSPIHDLTASVGAPRVAAIEYPLGQTFGPPGDAAGQDEVLRATLDVVRSLEAPGTVHLPFEWSEPANRRGSEPPEPPPIAQLLKRKPWLFPKLLERDPPSSDDHPRRGEMRSASE